MNENINITYALLEAIAKGRAQHPRVTAWWEPSLSGRGPYGTIHGMRPPIQYTIDVHRFQLAWDYDRQTIVSQKLVTETVNRWSTQ